MVDDTPAAPTDTAALSAVATARFFVGQCVQHKKFDYRGVVFDADATFRGTDEWYEKVARSRPPRDQPWYHVLVHRGTHTTYVAERHLEADEGGPIEHPLVGQFFDQFRDGRYGVKGGVQ